MRPTDLPSLRRQPTVTEITISGDDARLGSPDHFARCRRVTLRGDLKGCHLLRGVDPHPVQLALFTPACLIHVVDRLGAHELACRLDRCGQRTADLLLHGANAPDTYLDPVQNAQSFRRLT